jgi:hypothetical protein
VDGAAASSWRESVVAVGVSERFVVGYKRRMDSSFFYVFGNFKFGLVILNVAGDKPTRAFEFWLFPLAMTSHFSIWFDIYGEGCASRAQDAMSD